MCLKDAKKGNNLRCRKCSGPVVFGSAQNKEPQLNGKCISCFEKYEHFEESVKLFTDVKKSISELSCLTSVFQSEFILKKATKLLADLVDLSLPESEATCQMVFISSLIFEKSKHLLNDDKQTLELALLFDRSLPTTIPKHLLHKKSLRSLKFWLDLLLKKLARFKGLEVDEKEKAQLNGYWDSVNQFKQRLLKALQSISKDNKATDFVKQMINSASSELNQSVMHF